MAKNERFNISSLLLEGEELRHFSDLVTLAEKSGRIPRVPVNWNL